jgi:NADP-reducing hydrogenase subunit HndB
MKKIESIVELNEVRKVLEDQRRNDESNKVIIKVAMSTCSIATGSAKIINAFQDQMKMQAIDHKVIQTGCMGLCHSEPTVEVNIPGKDPVMFGKVDENKVVEIVNHFIKEGRTVDGFI